MKKYLTLCLNLFLPFLVFAQYSLNGNELVLPSKIVFKTGSAQIDPSSEKTLQYVATYLNDKKYITTLRIEAHCSLFQDESENLILSQQRAKAVCEWLITKGGIDKTRLLPVAFGSSKPIAQNNTPQGKSENTRILFVNAALKGINIGGMSPDGGGLIVN